MMQFASETEKLGLGINSVVAVEVVVVGAMVDLNFNSLRVAQAEVEFIILNLLPRVLEPLV